MLYEKICYIKNYTYKHVWVLIFKPYSSYEFFEHARFCYILVELKFAINVSILIKLWRNPDWKINIIRNVLMT